MWRISLTLCSQKGPPLKRRIASSTQTINCNFNNSSPAPSGEGAVCIPPTVGVARRCHFRCSGAGSACKRSDSNPPPLPNLTLSAFLLSYFPTCLTRQHCGFSYLEAFKPVLRGCFFSVAATKGCFKARTWLAWLATLGKSHPLIEGFWCGNYINRQNC